MKDMYQTIEIQISYKIFGFYSENLIRNSEWDSKK